ncbi:hypothetical protein BBP40_004824 [Aspergillus hancockii]|nr:hypothetical protein BBP40_004824 [Aspergillus hancockii]
MIPGVAVGSLVPPNSWGSHIHIIEPDGYPLSEDRGKISKRTGSFRVSNFHKSFGIKHRVVVLPSTYDSNNTVLVDALRYFNGTYRGVCFLDSTQRLTTTPWASITQSESVEVRLDYGNDEITVAVIKAARMACPSWGSFREVVELVKEHRPFVKVSTRYQNSKGALLYDDMPVAAETLMAKGLTRSSLSVTRHIPLANRVTQLPVDG